MSDSSRWLDSRIENALLWLLRLALFLLFVLAVVGGELQDALVFVLALVIHGVVYVAAPRFVPESPRRWGLILFDIVLAVSVFYFTGNAQGQGGIIGFCTAGIIAARLSLWIALAVNGGLWVAFSFPALHNWLGQGESFPTSIIWTFVAYLAFTLFILYVVSMEARQTRIAREAARRLRQLATVQEVGGSITSTLDMEQVLNMVIAKAVEILNAEAGSLLFLEDEENGVGPGTLVFRVVTGPVAGALIEQHVPAGEGIVGRVVQTGQGYLANAPADDVNWLPKFDELTGFETRSILCVPLTSRGHTVGALEVLNKVDGTPFDDEDMELLSTFAAQASIAMENARLYEQINQLYAQTDETLNKRLQELATIEEIDHELGSSLDYDRTIDLVLARAIEACGATDGAIGVLMPGEQQMEVRHQKSAQPGESPESSTGLWPVDKGIIGRVVRTGEAALIDDVHTDDDYVQTIETTRSELTVPIGREERVIGVLSLQSDRQAAFSPDDLRFLEHLADHAGIAIDNARLFESQQRQAREQTILYETSAAVTSSLELSEVLATIGRQVAAALDVSTCSISDWEQDENVVRTLVGETTIPNGSPGDVGISYSLDDYPSTARALRNREPVAIRVSDPDADPSERALMQEKGYKSLLMMPMVARDRVIGLLELYEERLEREFSPDDIRLCQALANQAAIALENARLYEQADEQLQSRMDQMTALQRTMQELNATLELDRILQVVLETAISTTGATHGNLMLMDLDTGEMRLRTSHGYADEERAAIEAELLNPAGDSLALQVLESGEPRIVGDARLESVIVCIRDDTRAALTVPVHYEGLVVGLINLRHTLVGVFDEEHLSFMQAMTEQAAVAIGNALRFEDQVRSNTALSHRNEQIDSLLAVSQKLRADVPLSDALEEVAYAIQETVGFDVVLIGIVEDRESDAPMVVRAAAAGLPLEMFEEARRVRQPLERYETLLHEEYREGPCYFFPFQKRDDWSAELHTLVSMPGGEEWQEGQWHPHDMLLAPLWGAGGRLLGHISVDEPRDGRRPSRQTLEALAVFANQAAIAVENTQLFEDAQRRAENLGLINRVAQTLTQVTEPSQVLDTVVGAVGELLQCDLSAIFQKDAVDDQFRTIASYGGSVDQMQELCLALGEGLVGGVVETGTPLSIADTCQDPRFAGLSIQVGSLICVPIVAGEQVSGVLLAGDEEGQALSNADQVLLTTLADQAAVALESARFFADTQQAAIRLSLLTEIGRRASAQLDMQDMLTMATAALHRNMGYYRVAAFLLDEVRQELYVAAANDDFWRVIPPGYRQKFGEGLVGTAAETGQTVLANDAATDERFVALDSWETPASLSVPIKIADKVVGILHVEADQRGAFADADASALEIAADQLAVAIQNAQLFKAIQRQAEQLGALRQVSQDLTALRDLDTLLHQIVDRAIQLLGAEAGGIYLYRPNRDLLEWTVAIGEAVASIGTTLERGEGLAGKVWETGKPATVDRYSDWNGRSDQWAGLNATVIAVPIQWGDDFLGVLDIQASNSRGTFTHQDADLLTQFSVQAAIAIQNADLFQQTRRRVAELATVNQIARAISSALDQEQLFELIYNQIGGLLDSRDFFIALYDAERKRIRIDFHVEGGIPQPPVYLQLGQGLTSYLITIRQPILLSHGVEEFIEEHSLTLEGTPAKSWLGVPMVAEDRVLGAIAVQDYERENAYDEGHLELMTIIAGQAAVAFQNASLFEEREQRIGELAVLNEMAQAISSTLELDALLKLVHKQTSLLVNCTNFYIALYDREEDLITFPFTVDPEGREDWGPRRGGMGLTGRIIESGEALLLPTGVAGLKQEVGEEVEVGLCRSWLGVPMIAEDKVLGVIAVQSYEQEHVYNQQDLNLLSTVAAQVAVAVRNAQLYQQIVAFSAELEGRVEERTRELAEAAADLTVERDRAETLYRITSELGTTLDLDRVLHRALQLFADTLQVDHGSVLLLDQDTGFLDLRATLRSDRRLPREGVRTELKMGMGLAGWVLQNREPALVPDIRADERWIDIPEMEVDARSVVVSPLSLGGGDVLGVLTLGHQSVGYFNEEHLQLVTAAAAQVAVAVSNSDLYSFITDQADQLGATLQAMQAEADKSRSILESIADGVLVLDHQGRVLLVNPAAEELLAISAMVLEGDHYRHMLGMGDTAAHRDLAQGLYTELRRRLEATEEDAAHLRATAVRLVSGNRVLAINIAPLITTIGETPGLVAALRDVSREAEVERLKNEFISTVSHELRTPMTSIKGYTDLLFLGMAGGLSDAQRNFLQIIKSNADRLTALVNDILDISRIETGRLRLNIEPLDIQDLISKTVTSFEEQYRDKGLALVWEEEKGVPEIRGDAARVTQVLTNLIANAWQYTPSGGSVTVSVHELEDFMRVDVTDTGIGIGPDDLPRVFDRFYRVDHPVVQEAEGTGLGLSIVRMFVEMLGGDIWVESELGDGSTFSFTVPLLTDEVPEEEILQSDLISPEVAVAVTRRPKILLVENNRDLALSLRKQLETEGYQALLAGSGQDALWLAQEEQPQLIALDIQLPDMDGFDVLEKLRQHPSTLGIPVIIISILSETKKGYALGAVDYVVKPFEEGKLLESVRLALSPHDDAKDLDLLVVDDDPDIRGLLVHALEYQGYQVRTATDGLEALEQVEMQHPNLILLDLKMPRMDGYAVIRKLKGDRDTRPIPIVVITASPVDKERDKVRVLGMGAQQYITKPLSIETLVREIRSVVEER